MQRFFKIKKAFLLPLVLFLAISVISCPVCFAHHAPAAPASSCHQNNDGSPSGKQIPSKECNDSNGCLSVALLKSMDSVHSTENNTSVLASTFAKDFIFVQFGGDYLTLRGAPSDVPKIPVRIINSVFRL